MVKFSIQRPRTEAPNQRLSGCSQPRSCYGQNQPSTPAPNYSPSSRTREHRRNSPQYTNPSGTRTDHAWIRAKVQINSSVHSLRKITVQQELNSWQQQVLLRKKNRQLLEQILQLKNPEALLKARQAKHHHAAAEQDRGAKKTFRKNTQISFHRQFLLKISI